MLTGTGEINMIQDNTDTILNLLLSPCHYLSGCKKALLLPRSAFPFPLFYYNPLLIDNQLFSEIFLAHSTYN